MAKDNNDDNFGEYLSLFDIKFIISPYRMISLIVAKLETNFLQQNYLGQSLAEADILCKKFHFEHFKKVPTYPLHQVLGMVQPLFGQKQHTSQTT